MSVWMGEVAPGVGFAGGGTWLYTDPDRCRVKGVCVMDVHKMCKAVALLVGQ